MKVFIVSTHDFSERDNRVVRDKLNVTTLERMPSDVVRAWNRTPPTLAPVRKWICTHANKGDFIIIHGKDPTACTDLAEFSRKLSLIPAWPDLRLVERLEGTRSQTVKRTHVMMLRSLRVEPAPALEYDSVIEAQGEQDGS